MAKNEKSSMTLVSAQNSSPLKPPEDQTPDIEKFRQTDDAKSVANWVKGEFQKAKEARRQKQLQWYVNMSYYYGKQDLARTGKIGINGYDEKLFLPRRPGYKQSLVINKTRSFVRTELSKFLSQNPSATVVPATSTDDDIRAAYAGEQAFESISTNRKLIQHFSKAMWWTIVTGNGFVKTWWDPDCTEKASGQKGDIRFGTVTPFNLYIPDIREQDIEDQPYVINAYVKPLDWCLQYFADELEGVQLQASTTNANQILDSTYLNLGSEQKIDSCTIYEAWLKPGAHKLFPQGAVIIMIDDTIVSITPDGMPYEHGEYPFTKFEHMPSGAFYADSPLVDTNPLQKEYNELRTDIRDAGRKMARPQLLAQKGSIIPGKVTNEAGLIIEYRPGTPAPQPLQLTPLPEYYVQQQDRVQNDWEDVTGQHDASKGDAPSGVTAGTAINYLQEKDDQFLTPQYQSVEQGWEKIGGQTLELFQQYVDLPRKIRTIGADGAFDTLELSGAEVGIDLRIEPGSSIAQSQAGKQAQVESMFSIGLIDGPTALKLLEIGGVQKVLDTMNVAERKAQRENTRMKLLTPEQIQAHEQAWAQQMEQAWQQQQIQQMEQQLQQPPLAIGPGGAPDALAGAGAPPAVPGTAPADPSQGMQQGQPQPQGPAGMSGMLGAPEQDPTTMDMTGQGIDVTATAGQPAGDPISQDPTALPNISTVGGPGMPPGVPPVIPVDDFDIHAVHIDTHNRFRMGQEYETLAPEVKMQFELHVKIHQQAMMQRSLQQFLSMIPSDGSDGGDSGSMDVTTPAQPGDPSSAQPAGPGATLSGNGQVAPDPTQGGQ